MNARRGTGFPCPKFGVIGRSRRGAPRRSRRVLASPADAVSPMADIPLGAYRPTARTRRSFIFFGLPDLAFVVHARPLTDPEKRRVRHGRVITNTAVR